MKKVTAIILAAGKGTRMQSTDTNKVALKIHGQSMLERTLSILKESGIENIVVVVGFAKESIINLLDEKIIVAEQTERLGTGHAVKVALDKIPKDCDSVLILYGDDAFLHDKYTYQDLYKKHVDERATITFITMDIEDPTGYGRILRDKNNEIVGIVEEKNANEEERKIKEINLGCYLIDKNYLMQNIQKIKKNELTGEFYITDIIDIIASNNGKIAALKLTHSNWRGVNTHEDLQFVEKMIKS